MSDVVTDKLMTLSEGRALSEIEAYTLMDGIMSGVVSPIQLAGVLMALRVRGETIDELTGFARAMRDHAIKVPVTRRPVLDTCGTGGDRSMSFNVSTVSAFVVAGAGIAVAKHGNRSATSKSGSADLLEALGVPISQDPVSVARSVDEIGFGFLFAQSVHTSMKFAAQTRRELGVRTVFNVLGPLTNPVNPERQLLGVFSPSWVEPITQVLARLGTDHAIVVHGAGGIDEVSLSGPTQFGRVNRGEVTFGEFSPEDLGLPRYPKQAIVGGDPVENAAICRRVLQGQPGAYLDSVLANAGVALFAARAVNSMKMGVDLAREVILQGQAWEVLQQLTEPHTLAREL
ncbi:MAG: anthranilate phosphoribosyltransferase [Firmicutes bacterium]|nr:anthranilate phosphoribosyltransferase [Bacillota bacterium]MCL5972563.1 anthranilate phosphoribosyltransferase [Bacillota bacterium]